MSFPRTLLALGLFAVSAAAAAQFADPSYGRGYAPYGGYDDAYDDRYRDEDRFGRPYDDRDEGGDYDFARVVRVDPVIVSDGRYAGRPECRSREDGDYPGEYARGEAYPGTRSDPYVRTGTETGRNVATVVGGVVGAVLGSKVGGGSARYATAAVGSMVGGMAGRQVYENSHRAPRVGVVTVCDPMPPDGDYYRVDHSRVGAYDVTYEYADRRYTTRMDHHPGDRLRVRVDVRPE